MQMCSAMPKLNMMMMLKFWQESHIDVERDDDYDDDDENGNDSD